MNTSYPMRPEPRPGFYVQVWLGAIRGSEPQREKQLLEFTRRARNIGVDGIILHAFPRGLARTWDKWSALVASEGLPALASWGLDGKKDDDGTPLTAKEKGELCGSVAAEENCLGSYLDAEGQWDTDQGEDDDMDERGAVVFGHAFRKEAPLAWVGDQCWFAIDSHGGLRRSALPLEAGRVFRGFPVDEFAASVVNGDRARQAYWANFFRQWGKDAYERIIAWMERDWARIRPTMLAAGLARTEAVSVQGYAHPDTVDFVDCLLDWGVNRQTRVVIWSEPFPSEMVLAAIAIAHQLRHRGFARAGVDPKTAIRAFQRDAGITVDGFAFRQVAQALGIPVPT